MHKPSRFSDLSFIRREPGANSNWALPAPPANYVQARRVLPDGSRMSRCDALYCIGCEQGDAAAREYRAFLLSSRERSYSGGTLQHLVLDMLEAPRGHLLRGQIVGFFSTLEAGVQA